MLGSETSCNTDSRQAECVQWPDHPDPPSGQIQWHSGERIFSSVGVHSKVSFDETFCEEVKGPFSHLISSQEVGSDGPFSASELRRVPGVDSAVGLDGVPCSLFKVPFPWWQRALLNFFNLVLFLGCGSHSVETEDCCVCVQTGRRRSRHQLFTPHLLRGAASNSSGPPHMSSQLEVCKVGFRTDVLVSSLLDVLSRKSAHLHLFRGAPESV